MLPRFTLAALLALLALLALGACQTPPYEGPLRTLRYTGSSTIAHFIRDARDALPRARLVIDTTGESAGGETAILAGTTDLAGVAGRLRQEPHPSTIRSAVIGRDAIAVIVHENVGVDSLKRKDLRRVFRGEVHNWKDLGGNDVAIRPFIVEAKSATRHVFRSSVLGEADYAGCEVVAPDADIVPRVGTTPGGIGHISFSFLPDAKGIRAITIDGEAPSVTNFNYPIARPLRLLWNRNNAAAARFADWALSSAGQRVVMRRFVANRVVAVTPQGDTTQSVGYLVVRTATYPVYDGGIRYYPHRPYDVLTRQGDLVRHVRNHRSENDDQPTRITLAPGTYLVRPVVAAGRGKPFFVEVHAGQTTTVAAPRRP